MIEHVLAQLGLSPTMAGVAAGAILLALVLLIAGMVSARRAAAPKAKALEKKTKELPKQLESRPPLKPLEVPKQREPEPTFRPVDELVKPLAPLEPQVELSPEERAKLKEEEEERKREAYRLKKAAEAEEKERKRQEAEAQAAAAAEAERLRLEEEARQAAEAKAEEQRRIQAQAGKTLADGLAKTRGGFMSRLNGLFGGPKVVDGQLLGELEEVLFSADIGVKTASQLLEVARQKLGRGELADPQAVKGAIRQEIERIIEEASQGGTKGTNGVNGPRAKVWMIVGVNGVGKTTTIGKLAAQLTREGKKVVLGAADTFRAAATEQLEIWAQRANAEIVKGAEGSDPGAVAFEAVKRGKEVGADYVLIDTAGRLHTKAPLMEELKKIKRVLAKADPHAPDQVLLVLDSTNGQNAIAQARQFNESLQVTEIALTKLDGTAKGGVVIGICDELKLPLRYVGVGEAVGDLRSFQPREFVEALFA